MIRGNADGEAARIYAASFGKPTPNFTTSTARCKAIARPSCGKDNQGGDVKMILSPDNEYLKPFPAATDAIPGDAFDEVRLNTDQAAGPCSIGVQPLRRIPHANDGISARFSGIRRGKPNVRYVYGITTALLLGWHRDRAGHPIAPLGAQVAQNEKSSEMANASSPARARPTSFADLVEQLQPAVVNISTKPASDARHPHRPPFAGTREPVTQEQQGGGSRLSDLGRRLYRPPTTMSSRRRPARRGGRSPSPSRMTDQKRIYARRIVGRDTASDLALCSKLTRPACRSSNSPIQQHVGAGRRLGGRDR